MRIAIYNRWLATLGGGERDMAAFAEALQDDHTVDLLTHSAVDLPRIAGRLGLDLGGVSVRTLPFDPEFRAVVDASAEYDLFVNMSHGDMFAPRARRNLLRVFFPADPSPAADDQQRAVGGAGPRLTLLHGFYAPEKDEGQQFAWTGAEAELIFAWDDAASRSKQARHLQLLVHGWRPGGAEPARVSIAVEGRIVAERHLPIHGAWSPWQIPIPKGLADARTLRVSLATTTFNPATAGMGDDNRDLGLALAGVLVQSARWLGMRRALPTTDSIATPDRGAYEAMIRRRVLPAATAYDRLVAISRFTQLWIARRWSLSSDIIYPPADVEQFQPGRKQPYILSVGRFFAGSHNKKHLAMIEAFRGLCDSGLSGWEYHLAGGADEAMPEQRAYLDQVRAAASGYPIVIHANSSFAELRKLYAGAAIFWHATGYGEDGERTPELFEHFGITTVEAMAAGCVPVVIGQGGQIEIVEPGRSGFLWQTLPELAAHTRLLIADVELRGRMAGAARERSRAFDSIQYASEVRNLVADLARSDGA